MSLGVIILGHGSKLDAANQELYKIVQLVREKLGNIPVEAAFMSQASPNLSEALLKLFEKNIKRVIVAPLFLFPGMHIRQDIPEILAEEKAKYAGQMEIVLASNLGTDSRIADILIDRIQEVL